jgi:hypothetical protein
VFDSALIGDVIVLFNNLSPPLLFLILLLLLLLSLLPLPIKRLEENHAIDTDINYDFGVKMMSGALIKDRNILARGTNNKNKITPVVIGKSNNDNKLINRELECWDKVNYLKSLGEDIKLTAHVMSMSGNHPLSAENITERCLDEGFEIIYLHSRAFKDFNRLQKFKETLFNGSHHIFGIVSELKKNKNLIDFAKDI